MSIKPYLIIISLNKKCKKTPNVFKNCGILYYSNSLLQNILKIKKKINLCVLRKIMKIISCLF